jgi:hypothetical protein
MRKADSFLCLLSQTAALTMRNSGAIQKCQMCGMSLRFPCTGEAQHKLPAAAFCSEPAPFDC